MTEEITIYLLDMEAFLEPEEYGHFLQAKHEVEEYRLKLAEYEDKKASAEWFRNECRKKEAEAESNLERTCWGAMEIISSMEAPISPPSKPTYYFQQHDQYVDLVRERKLKHLEELECVRAEEDAERQRWEEQKRYEQHVMDSTMKQIVLADSEWAQFLGAFNLAVDELKKQLANPKPPIFNPRCSLKVLDYHPESWCDLKLPDIDQVDTWAEPQILERIPPVLHPFVTWDITPRVFVVPKVEYRAVGLGCLVWHFSIYLSAKVDLWLEDSTLTKEFQGWKYSTPINELSIGAFFLAPQKLDSHEGLVMPIALLRLLVEGKVEVPGMEVIASYDDGSIYEVEGFEERRLEYHYIDVREEFRRFIKDITKDQSLSQALLDSGILSGETTAKLIEEKWDMPLPIGSGSNDTDGSDMESVVTKLVELGWTENDAREAVETIAFPQDANAEEMMKIILDEYD